MTEDNLREKRKVDYRQKSGGFGRIEVDKSTAIGCGLIHFVMVLCTAAWLTACGGGSSNGSSAPILSTSLIPGSSFTMPANTSVLVPSGTTVTFNGSAVTVNGSDDTIGTSVGAVVTVPASATGQADNTVTTIAAIGGSPSTTPTVTLLAGLATTNAEPIDGTGSAAILSGGGNLAVDSADEVIFSDRGVLRKVTQAGMVTTLQPISGSCIWQGIAVDSGGNIYGSGSEVGSGGYDASICEVPAAGAVSILFPDWESGGNSDEGFGGMAVDVKGNLFVADAINNRVAEFAPGNGLTVLAGGGASGNTDGAGAAATFSMIGSPDLPIDSAGNLYLNTGGSIREITPAGAVSTIVTGLSTDGQALARDASGNFYVHNLNVLYRIASDGTVTPFAFPQTQDFVTSMTTDPAGNLYVGTRGIGAQIFKVTFQGS